MSRVDGLPNKPGIYFFKNGKGQVVYIGKARSLRDRVRSYFQATADPKVNNILSETAEIDFILTDSEKEAAFLENNFVQQYQPKFNLRLKDDKSFPYLRLTVRDNYPAIYFTRKVEEDGARYFGPFAPPNEARRTIHLVNKYFGVRGCEEPVPGKRKRPCLEFELKLCSAPCVGYVSEKDYRESVENALLLLEGKTEKLAAVLKQKMRQSSDQQKFEEAARWRDIIRTLEEIKARPKFISPALENLDIFGFARESSDVAIFIFFMRRGKVRESREIFFRQEGSVRPEEILSKFGHDFYSGREERPDKILMPLAPPDRDELALFLSGEKGKKIEIVTPVRGKYKGLVELANRNAEILLHKKKDEASPAHQAMAALGLPILPRTIEGYDISNTGGEESVGSVVVFEDGLPQKEKYRKYRIESVRGPNDVASLGEVIRRRYTKILKEKRERPDLILVDGGKGQLRAALKSLAAVGAADIPVISLAKREETIFSPDHKEGSRLDRTSPALKLFQNIRDEAHRFAVSFHRRRREKRSFESVLDDVPGLGKKRKAALLSLYKSTAAMRKAGPAELAKITGPKVAEELLKRI